MTIASFIKIITDLASQAIGVLVALALLFFVWGIANWILNTADTEKHKQGRDRAIWGVIALFVLVSLWGIINILDNTFLGGKTNTASSRSPSSLSVPQQPSDPFSQTPQQPNNGGFLNILNIFRGQNQDEQGGTRI